MNKLRGIGLVLALIGAGCTAGDPSTAPEDAEGVDRGSPSTPAVTCSQATEGADCDDQDLCTLDDRCLDGACVGTSDRVCDEEGPCRAGGCDAATGCVYNNVPDDTPCSLACFGSARCIGGSCIADGATEVQCPAPEGPCVASLECDSTTGACSKETLKPEGTPCDLDADHCTLDQCGDDGQCQPTGGVETCEAQHLSNLCWTYICTAASGCTKGVFVAGASCSDSNPCTVNDTCAYVDDTIEACVGTPVAFDDNNPCTDDGCGADGITHTPIDGLPCTPVSPCATSAVCENGTCTDDTVCECAVDADCEQPTDLCAAKMVCDLSGSAPQCVADPATQVICVPSGPCMAATCAPATGLCSETVMANGQACEDGDLCIVDEVCFDGGCTGGVAIECDDGLFCTGVEACNPAIGCISPAPPADDGVACTIDSCDELTQFVFHSTDPTLCTDDDPCTDDVCTSATGCTHTPSQTPECGGPAVGPPAGTCDALAAVPDGLYARPADVDAWSGLFQRTEDWWSAFTKEDWPPTALANTTSTFWAMKALVSNSDWGDCMDGGGCEEPGVPDMCTSYSLVADWDACPSVAELVMTEKSVTTCDAIAASFPVAPGCTPATLPADGCVWGESNAYWGLCSAAGTACYGCWWLRQNNWLMERMNHPVHDITYQQAADYCAWLGGRLPTWHELAKLAIGGCELYPGADCLQSTYEQSPTYDGQCPDGEDCGPFVESQKMPLEPWQVEGAWFGNVDSFQHLINAYGVYTYGWYGIGFHTLDTAEGGDAGTIVGGYGSEPVPSGFLSPGGFRCVMDALPEGCE